MTTLSCSESASIFWISDNQVFAIIGVRLTTIYITYNPPKSYYKCCETEFKSRFYNHCQTFKNKQKKYTTKLSKAFWEAIDNWREPRLEWSISTRSSTYQPGVTRCNLCLDEKLAILLADPPSTLNKRIKSSQIILWML